MGFELKSRRAVYVDIAEEMKKGDSPVSSEQVQHLETFDLIYRSLCALLYNYAPLSGHPGGFHLLWPVRYPHSFQYHGLRLLRS